MFTRSNDAVNIITYTLQACKTVFRLFNYNKNYLKITYITNAQYAVQW